MQPLAHARLLHTTLESRQSITPPVESYTGPAALATKNVAACPDKADDHLDLYLNFFSGCMSRNDASAPTTS